MVPLKYAYIFKDKIKDSQLVTIPNVGHSPNLEVPGKLAEIVLNFLKDQEK
jgi:pimeloyl-ACP methyl ester carboxylesterase